MNLDTREELELHLKEIERRGLGNRTRFSFLDPVHVPQYKAAVDKSFLKGIQSPRRSGKSTGEVRETLEEAEIITPGSNHLYGALTLSSAKEIAWDTFLENLDAHKVKHSINSQSGIITLDNGSKIRLFGLDSSYKEMRKLLGSKYKTVKIDEAGSITQDLRKVCYQMIMPALTDMNGRLALLGTAENIPNTFFEKVTSGKEPGWSIHKWMTIDNPYMREKWIAHLQWIKDNNPEFMLTSEYKTHYLNEWCADDNKLIIKLMDSTVIKPFTLSGYDYLLSMDLGYNDATSFTVIAHSSHDPVCYAVKSFKSPEMDFTDVANTIKQLQSKYPITRYKIDGANKQGVQEIVKRHKLPLDIADKSGKATHLRLLRDDVIQGKFKIFEGECDPLVEEWKALQWKDDLREEEDPRCQNHCSDGALYGWREARNYTYQTPEPKLNRNTDEYMKDFEKKEQRRLAQLIKEQDEYTLNI